jgi:hypothetical protein
MHNNAAIYSSPFLATEGITEKLLQYIWQFQYFNKSELKTTGDYDIEIISAGTINKDQGPDFTNAKIKINNAVVAGSIELHLKTSLWKKHKHHTDPNYKNVVLHVVFEHDTEMSDELPVLELKTRIPKLLLTNYQQLMANDAFIPCAGSISTVKEITWTAWKERLLAERLIRKSKAVFSHLQKNNAHWEETFWWLVARNFGIKINADAFEQMAQSVPLNILAKHKNQIHQLEALLFGQAGLLNDSFTESYPQLLQKEYQFLRSKYNLVPNHTPVHFLRMRPLNFPTIRLAQLAMLVHNSNHLLTKILEAKTVAEVMDWLSVTANDYWHYHYQFDVLSEFRQKKLGSTMIENILINTVVPVVFAYGHHHNNETFKTRALSWLEQIKSEQNIIINEFSQLSIKSKSAFDSQAIIELKNEYCTQKRCLECSVGNYIFKQQ